MNEVKVKSVIKNNEILVTVGEVIETKLKERSGALAFNL
jgi:hypothetical protein